MGCCYNKTIGTVEANGESDKFLIKGLFIQDTYNFADEDPITEDTGGLQHGKMVWTVLLIHSLM